MWWLLWPSSLRMCSVMPAVFASDWKKCSTSCVSKLPMRSVGMSQSKLRCGRPDRSCVVREQRVKHPGSPHAQASNREASKHELLDSSVLGQSSPKYSPVCRMLGQSNWNRRFCCTHQHDVDECLIQRRTKVAKACDALPVAERL